MAVAEVEVVAVVVVEAVAGVVLVLAGVVERELVALVGERAVEPVVVVGFEELEVFEDKFLVLLVLEFQDTDPVVGFLDTDLVVEFLGIDLLEILQQGIAPAVDPIVVHPTVVFSELADPIGVVFVVPIEIALVVPIVAALVVSIVAALVVPTVVPMRFVPKQLVLEFELDL